MKTEFLTIDDLNQKLIGYLRSENLKRIMVSGCRMFERLDLVAALRAAGFDAQWWADISLDQSYEFDCAVTDCTFAVAEIGGLVIKTTAQHGRALTLVPLHHIAVVEPRSFLPDMVDLFEKLSHDDAGPYVVMISGPSKTADIEMNVVTGVHGPNVVKTYILQ